MRTLDNGFVRFMCKLDGKEVKVKTRTKEPWPAYIMDLVLFKHLVHEVAAYEVGEVLDCPLLGILFDSFEWATHDLEEEFAAIHEADPISQRTLECFQAWHERLTNGDTP